MAQRWPDRIWIVRHGESAANVARDAAFTAGLPRVDLPGRDNDVALSARGVEQSDALGHWFATMPEAARPNVLLTSPYVRARQTAERIVAAGGLATGCTGPVLDERLREKEVGVLEHLTRYGIEQEYPQQAFLRRELGKFYYRPPGGESWCDVILRLRSELDTLRLRYGGRRVMIVAHQVVVLCMRYLLEELDEERILAIDSEGDVANCGVTEYVVEPPGKLVLCRYNFVAPLEREGAPVTAEPSREAAR